MEKYFVNCKNIVTYKYNEPDGDGNWNEEEKVEKERSGRKRGG